MGMVSRCGSVASAALAARLLLAVGLLLATVAHADDAANATASVDSAAPAPREPRGADLLQFTDVTLDCADAAAWLEAQHARIDEQVAAANAAQPTHGTLEDKVKPAPMPATNRRNYKLLCITYTYPGGHTKAAAARRAWGSRCTRHVVVTNQPPVEGVDERDVLRILPRHGESTNNLWVKIQMTWEEVAAKFGDTFDYFFIGGDDVMLVPDNLLETVNEPGFAAAHDAGAPLFFGTRFISPPGDKVKLEPGSKAEDELHGWDQHGEFLSGAGYTLNAAAVRLLVHGTRTRQPECNTELQSHAEDVYIARCLEHFGVMPREARDAQGEDRVIVMTAGHMANQAANADYTWWFRDFRPYQHPRGSDIVSRGAYVFHYVGPGDMDRLSGKYFGPTDGGRRAG